MSLADLIAGHDQDALIASSSKGVVIRAGKDVAAGKVRLAARDETSATLDADQQTATLSAAKLSDARCSCPATGLCRHIIASVLYLRASGGTPPQLVVWSHQHIASHQDIAAFAGADWPRAVSLAAEGGSVTGQSGRTVSLAATGEVASFFCLLSH
ncbi:MAG: SWIM zinc finger family protein [Rhodobacteraceae bacterium]|nr:SWIM zinc finger family protein [Paracoccaceae bacterium]